MHLGEIRLIQRRMIENSARPLGLLAGASSLMQELSAVAET
jgi:hypothetical protein